jgi:anti-sigma-K factor RskA
MDNIKEYISSGILEIYVMGSLSSEEMAEVEQMAAAHPEIAEELNDVQNAVNNYSGAYKRTPRPLVREELMQKIEVETWKSKRKSRTIQEKHIRTYRYLIAACIVSLILSTAASVFFYLKWSDAEDRYVTMRIEKNKYARDYYLVKYENEKMNEDVSVMNNPSMDIITMNAYDSTKSYMARVYWNKLTRETFVFIHDLPLPAEDKQYQLWALVSGQPTDAGIFNKADEFGIQKLKPVQHADVWAVTLEPKGGSTAPTMDQMYLMSKI